MSFSAYLGRKMTFVPGAVSVVLALIVSFVGGCSANEPKGIVELPVDEAVFYVEIADEPEERQRGLMYREELAEDHGMLFVFPSSETRSFWMKDTRIPLSIAYISSRGEILEIYDMEPLSLDPVPSRYPAQYALELNQSAFERNGIAVGDVVDLDALPRWVSPR